MLIKLEPGDIIRRERYFNIAKQLILSNRPKYSSLKVSHNDTYMKLVDSKQDPELFFVSKHDNEILGIFTARIKKYKKDLDEFAISSISVVNLGEKSILFSRDMISFYKQLYEMEPKCAFFEIDERNIEAWRIMMKLAKKFNYKVNIYNKIRGVRYYRIEKIKKV